MTAMVMVFFLEAVFNYIMSEDLVLNDPNFQYNSSITMNCPPGYDWNTAIEVDLGNIETETNDYWYVFTADENGQYDINM